MTSTLSRRGLLLGGAAATALPLLSHPAVAAAGKGAKPALVSIRPAAQIIVYDGTQLRAAVAAAVPGDVITLAAANMASAGALTIKVPNVTIRAMTPLAALLSGPLTVSAPGVAVDGLALNGAAVTLNGDGIRLTRCRVTNSPAGWPAIAVTGGRGVRVGYCEVGFHKERGIAIWREAASPWIEHNWIHDAVKSNATNGHEGIQVGRSQNDTNTRVGAVVEYNVLERVEAEQEAISVKCSGNMIRFNALRDSHAFFSNRHGEDNTYAGNNLERTYGFMIQDRGTRLLGNRVASQLDKSFSRVMGGTMPWNMNTQGQWPQCADTYLCGNQLEVLMIGQMPKSFTYPAINTTVAAHTGKVKFGSHVGTNMNGAPVPYPTPIVLATADTGPLAPGAEAAVANANGAAPAPLT